MALELEGTEHLPSHWAGKNCRQLLDYIGQTDHNVVGVAAAVAAAVVAYVVDNMRMNLRIMRLAVAPVL